ncbi:glycosyltransferase [Pseudodesulfovibrio sp. zrk46]|uniref:glycosyltransferase n=1 Tax=Pseudodesulfovibrio sp. zrk46 TaxID=2725288 RepID=UPI0014496101|nr:glycosyltransferase [Pseudodesulfovibrio sp. zrk46]QJB58104.1 glycosyltransferase [Pseudodesulfovibrio sp. zrk46]
MKSPLSSDTTIEYKPDANMMQASYIPTDRFEELDHIDLDGVFNVLEIYCDNLLPDLEACLVFLLRILRDKEAASHPKTLEWITGLVRKAIALGPFHKQALDLAQRLTGDMTIDARLERMAYFDLDPQLLDFRSVMNDPAMMRRKRILLTDVLDRMSAHVIAASQLLQLEYYAGNNHPEWLENFNPPKFFQEEWKQRTFLHYAGLGDVERAMKLWPEIASQPISEIQLNLAAELHAKSGDTEQALALYERSLAIDPRQKPVRLRIEELRHPSPVNASLLDKHSVTICLYSWNKADDLQKTFESLAQTNIGPAKIRVLLNGCTDHSAEVVERARALFPDNDFDVVTLPINVGAPAARNWLGALPEVRQSDFVAYVDDDVELPSDWLVRYLSVMNTHPDTSVVGGKVVFGSEPRMIQYLHRRFSVVYPGMIKLTDQCQIAQMDFGQYDYICETDTVMGCCHLLRIAHMPDGPNFDIRYSPSQIDDIAHDLKLRVDGGKIRYCGLVRCIHHQNTGGGFKRKMTSAQLGQVIGNDMKLTAYLQQHSDRIKTLMNEAER